MAGLQSSFVIVSRRTRRRRLAFCTMALLAHWHTIRTILVSWDFCLRFCVVWIIKIFVCIIFRPWCRISRVEWGEVEEKRENFSILIFQFSNFFFSNFEQIREPLFPIVCSTAAKTEMVLCNTKRDFANLQDRCRAAIMLLVKNRDRLETLKLPFSIKNYLAESLCDTPDAILNNYPNYYDYMVWDHRHHLIPDMKVSSLPSNWLFCRLSPSLCSFFHFFAH